MQVYGINGNAQALENITNGFMTATAWQDSFSEGYNMVKMLDEIKTAGDAWQPKAAEVTAVLVTADNDLAEAATLDFVDARLPRVGPKPARMWRSLPSQRGEFISYETKSSHDC